MTDLDTLFKRIESRRAEEWDALSDEEKRRREEAAEAARAEARLAELLQGYARQNIPPRYFDVTWDNWTADTPQKARILETVKNAWSQNLFLHGKCGTGKTHLAMCLAKDGATYRRLPDLFREARGDLGGEQKLIDKYGNVKLLVLDEIGRQRFSDFEKNLFFEIIDKRWNTIKPTTLITNLTPREMAAEYGAAVFDRLRPVPVEFDGESRRAPRVC